MEPLAARAALADRSEQPSIADAAAAEPCAHERDGVARELDDLAASLAEGLGAAHPQGRVAPHFLK